MTELVALALRTYLIGIAVAAPVGAMGVLCIQRTLSRGWKAGVVTGAGIATADALYAAIAAFGVTSVTAALAGIHLPLRIVGGVVLVVLGLRSASTAASAGSTRAPTQRGGAGLRGYLGSVALTLTNPMTVVAFGAVFAGAGLESARGVAGAFVATAGVAAGSFTWWIALASSVALSRHALTPTAIRVVGVGSGLVVAAFGAITAWTAVA